MEEWRPIVGYPGYTCSNLGNIKGLKGQIMNGTANPDGYLYSTFRIDGRSVTPKFHRLIGITFLGPQPFPDWQIDHLNRIRADNRVENLAWKSPADNAANTGAKGSNKDGIRGLYFIARQEGLHSSNAHWTCKIIRLGIRHQKSFPETQRAEAILWLQAKRQELNIPQ